MNAKPVEVQLPPTTTAVLGDSKRHLCLDGKFASESKVTTPFPNYLFQRLVSKEVNFLGVDFSYTIFDTCYLRKCVFRNCNFTGCRFIASNLYGSTFIGCTFDYVTFERTIIDSAVLHACCPGHENLKLKFARTLRVNFQSLGDAAGVNKAIKVELAATLEHFYKGWKSPEAYYRSKYTGLSRAGMFFKWLGYKIGDYIWGNGESIWKLTRAIVVAWFLMAIADVHLQGKSTVLLTSYLEGWFYMPSVFFGLNSPKTYPGLYLSLIVVIRLVAVAFLLSIIIKRFSRR